MPFPENLHYTKDHEWILLEGDTATIGITDYAQKELGDIVYVEIESKDKSLTAETVFGTVEAVKTVSDLFLPVSGMITEVNPGLEANPELVNSDPYGKGWMVKMKVDDPADVEKLMKAADYEKLGAYLPLSTTLPIFAGGVVKGLVDWKGRKKAQPVEEDDLGKGNLFATGLVAGGALAGVAVALLTASSETLAKKMEVINFEHGISNVIGENLYMLLGVLFFLAMAVIMYRVAIKKSPDDLPIDV
jgi:glycine cleavage system H protein